MQYDTWTMCLYFENYHFRLSPLQLDIINIIIIDDSYLQLGI